MSEPNLNERVIVQIHEFKACAAQVFPAREEELANPDLAAH